MHQARGTHSIHNPWVKPHLSHLCAGFYDFVGGEFVWLNGMVHVEMTESTVNLGVGHRALHTVLSLAPPQPISQQPMLRVSFVLWSKVGEEVPSMLDKIRAESDEGSEASVRAREAVHIAVRSALLVPTLNGMGTRSAATHRPPWLAVGLSIEARYQASIRGHASCPGWYSGIVTTLNPDGTCAVQYEDGDFESHVMPHFIRPKAWLDPYVIKEEGLHTATAQSRLIFRLRSRAAGKYKKRKQN